MLITRTPLRMSFAGGGTDLKNYYSINSGSVVSSSINKYIYICLNKKFKSKFRVSYSVTEYVDDIKEIKHNIIREALSKFKTASGIDIVYMSDMLPDHEGSGLGASSSLSVGVLNALANFNGNSISVSDLAKDACKLEIETLNHKIGKQDQYAAAFGGFNYIVFNRDGSVRVEPIKLKKIFLKKLESKLLLFYSKKNKRSDEILVEQNKNTAINKNALDKLKEYSIILRDELENGNINVLGNILDETWKIKQTLSSKISDNVINNYYEKAIEAGALGGKILGSGGGGFFCFYCDEDKQESLRQALYDLKECEFRFDDTGSQVVYRD